MKGQDIEDFFVNAKRLVRYTSIPDRNRLFQMGKIILLTFAILGGLSFVIRLIFSAILQFGGV